MAFSCRTVLSMATTNRQLIVHHLRNLPGHLKDLKKLSTERLFQLLLQRSYQQLLGAEFYSDRKIFNFAGKKLNSRASVLKSRGERGDFVLVFQNDERVYKFEALTDEIGPRRRLRSPATGFGTAEILFVAETNDTVTKGVAAGSPIDGTYILHRFKPSSSLEEEEERVGPDHPFVQHAKQSNPKGEVFLSYHNDTLQRPIYLYNFPEEKDYDPIAFAAFGFPHGSLNTFAISWEHQRIDHDHHVVHYTVEDDEYRDELYEDGFEDQLDSKYYPYTLTETINPNPSTEDTDSESDSAQPKRKPSTKLVFNDGGGQILHSRKGQTLYSSFQRLNSIDDRGRSDFHPKMSENGCLLQYSKALSLKFNIDIPFFSTHDEGNTNMNVQVNEDGNIDIDVNSARCHWQYLAIGLATHRVEHWTVACLLKSEARCRAETCGHVENLDRGRRFDQWKIMARLDGYVEANTSCPALITASSGGTRVAAASWKTITVWTFDPNEIIRNPADREGIYPSHLHWDSDEAEGVVDLQPVKIDVGAVCSQIVFSEEDQLLAITDRGLMMIDLSSEGKGKEIVEDYSAFVEEDEPWAEANKPPYGIDGYGSD